MLKSGNALRESGADTSSRNSGAGDDDSGGAAKFFADSAEDARAITKLEESKTRVVMYIRKQAEERKAKRATLSRKIWKCLKALCQTRSRIAP
jgi:hypothetical protein